MILASGTLSPVSLIKSQLFSKALHLERLQSFSCTHIVPQDRVLALALTHGPSQRKLDLRFENRATQTLLEEVLIFTHSEPVEESGTTCALLGGKSHPEFLQHRATRLHCICAIFLLFVDCDRSSRDQFDYGEDPGEETCLHRAARCGRD